MCEVYPAQNSNRVIFLYQNTLDNMQIPKHFGQYAKAVVNYSE